MLNYIVSVGRVWGVGDWGRKVSQQRGSLWGDEVKEIAPHRGIEEKLIIKKWYLIYNLKLNDEPTKLLFQKDRSGSILKRVLSSVYS